ncbi:hypothetical protein Droror1_Dr00016127, partial [Drosera rotundifolia]
MWNCSRICAAARWLMRLEVLTLRSCGFKVFKLVVPSLRREEQGVEICLAAGCSSLIWSSSSGLGFGLEIVSTIS